MPELAPRRCADPVVLPDRPLTQAEVETLWADDRAALVNCGWSLAGLLDFYNDLRAGLAAADRSKAK